LWGHSGRSARSVKVMPPGSRRMQVHRLEASDARLTKGGPSSVDEHQLATALIELRFDDIALESDIHRHD
jgi:hypothetical protein